MIIERFLPIWLCLISLVAFNSTSWLGFDLFDWDSTYLLIIIYITMFAIGWLLPVDEVRQVAKRWRSVLSGTCVQYTSMPILAYMIGKLFQLGDDAMIGIVMVGCVPGAMASNVLTLVAKGNASYSVSLTTSATLLSPLMVPLALFLSLGKHQSIDFVALAAKLLLTVVWPVVNGHLLSRDVTQFRERSNKLAVIVANLAILLIIAWVVAKNRELLRETSVMIVAALLCLNLLGYLTGYAAATTLRLPEGMRRALTLEIGMQNAGVGTALAASLFADRPAVTIPTAIYTFGCMLTGTMLARLWAMGSGGVES